MIKKKYINRLLYSVTAMLSMMVIAACNQGTKTKEPLSQGTEKTSGDTVELTKAQIETVGIETGTIQQRNLSELIKVNGQLMVPPESKADINTLIGGVVRNILVKEGAYVRKGQVLAYIENPEFIRMQQEYLTTKSNLVYVTQEYERQKRLNDQNAGTGKVFQQAQATYLTEQAKLSALTQQLQQIHISTARLDKGSIKTQIPVLSPISGQISHIMINIGSSADMNKILMEVIDNTAIYCDLKIFQKDLHKVKVNQKITYQLAGQADRTFKGKIRSINSTYEVENRIVIAHAAIDHESNDMLIPGTYVSASVQIGNKTVSAVPLDAVVNAEGKEFIFLVLPASNVSERKGKNQDTTSQRQEVRYKKMEVVTGLADLGFVELKLLKPLPANTLIVTKGARYVLAQSQGGQSDDE